ncbi:MAG: hypothetical protein QOD76_1229, partial [Solirubrobacteraceae bacterium]|nr:hypothetical protein [Solirubrobacteraceae bacterium]
MVTDFYPPILGGVEILVQSLAGELARRGHEVSVATLAARGLPSEEIDGDVRIHRIGASAQRAAWLFKSDARQWAPPVPDPEATMGLRTVVAKERPDVVHGHDWLARSYLPLKRRRGPALVMSLHYFTLTCPKKNLMYDGAPCSGPGLAKCLGCASRHYGRAKGPVVVVGQRTFAAAEARMVDLFLPVSEATAVGNGLPRAGLPHEVIHNFVRPPTASADGDAQRLAELPTEPFLLFVGDVRRDKGIHVLLEAYQRLRSPPPLALVGKVWPDTPAE